MEISPARIVTYRGQSARLLVGRDVTEHIGLREQVPMTERLASIGMLAAGVAHEVNNPLAYVLNNIEMARRDIASLGNAACRSREALGTALEGVDRIRTVVRDLLALSRVDDDAIGPIDAAAVIESTLRQSVGTRPTERRLSRLDRIDSRCAHGPGSSCRQPFSSPWRQEQLTPGANSLKSRECYGSPPPQWSRT